MRCAVLATAALLGSAFPSCTGLRFHSLRAGLEPDLRAARALEPGASTLAQCLTTLGAPQDVEEDESAGGGRVLTWAWEDVGGWGFYFSLPLSEYLSASLNYDAAQRGPQRLRLVFDERWVLRESVVE
jgi:hypothetical protein